MLYVAYMNFISYLSFPFCIFVEIKKAFQSVLFVIVIVCYNLLQDFVSLIIALMRLRNTREKDITQEIPEKGMVSE